MGSFDPPVNQPTFRDWLRDNGYILKEFGKRLLRYNGGAVLKHLQPQLAKIHFGPTVFEYDWNCCIVLDTCRHDALQAVAPEYDWLPDEIGSTRSVSSWSREWMAKSFGDEWGDEKARTAHITWNPFSEQILDPDDWLLLDEVWNGNWDNENGWLHPEIVTDHAIAAGREYDPGRLLVHYQQPHAPYRIVETERLTEDGLGDVENERHTVWDRIQDPDDPLTAADAYEGHLDALRWALEHVEILLENVDAERVLLTADHGEGFGEWWVYGHGMGMPFPKLITVPKVWLSATDKRTRKPDVEFETEHQRETADEDVKERLRALNYIE